jgi:hypothetical protein
VAIRSVPHSVCAEATYRRPRPAPKRQRPRRAVTGAIIAASSAGFVHASHAAWAVLAGCGLTVMLLGTVSTGRWALATAERNGARLATDMSPTPEGAR